MPLRAQTAEDMLPVSLMLLVLALLVLWLPIFPPLALLGLAGVTVGVCAAALQHHRHRQH